MFSQPSVRHSVLRGGMHDRGMHGGGGQACIVGGILARQGHAWWGACMAGWGACMVGACMARGMHGQHAWQGHA